MKPTNKAKLTVRTIERIPPGPKDIILWDTELRGFGCKVTPAGRRSFFVYYRTKDGQQRRPSIGLYGVIKPEEARRQAQQMLADAARGEDPSKKRQAGRASPTVKELCAKYLAEHARVKKKTRSFDEDARLIDRRIIPAIGSMRSTAVERKDIARLHHQLQGTPYEANRVIALLHKMFSLAERWGIRSDGSNPASNIDRFKEEKRERFLGGDEIAHLIDVLRTEQERATASPSSIAAIRLLLFTGCRLSEILTLRWQEVDLVGKRLRLADSKSGAKTVYLNDLAVEVLDELCRQRDPNNPYVIAGKRLGAPLINLQKPWRRIRKLAGLDDVRLHDLRHTYASIAAGAGLSLPLIGKLLGHSQPATTARYAHLANDPVRQGADLIGNHLSKALQGGEPKAMTEPTEHERRGE
jgi:integrase